MRLGVLVAAALTASACSSSSSGSGSGNSGPAKAEVDQSALLFGLVTGNGVLVGTQPSNSVQVFNSGTGTVTISGAAIATGASTVTQQLPIGPGGMLETQTLAADTTHSDFFTASAPSASSVSGSSASVIQVIFNPTLQGLFSAALNITTSTGTISVVLAGEAVTPLIATADGGTSFTVPEVTLTPQIGDDGGPVVLVDGGPTYQTGYSSLIIPLFNPGSATLNLQPATLDTMGDVEDWELCHQTSPSVNCNPGPLPTDVGPGYSDGGLAVGAGFDGGNVILSSDLHVFFQPATPGTFTQTVTVDSDATNTPMLTLTVTGTAVAP